MATPLTAPQMVKALKDEGVKVKEHRSWRTHNRETETGKPFGPVYGVMIHHTVTPGATPAQTLASVELCYNGHASLPGPLCHAVGAKDGTVYLVGHGRANHAGLGDDDVLAAVKLERTLPADNEANTDGNDSFYGIELINKGTESDPYPAAQYDAAVKWAAAICRAHGWTEKSVIGHKEWQPGKIDPLFPMDSFRAAVRRQLARTVPAPAKPPTPTTPPKVVTPMALTQADIDAVANKVAQIMLSTDGKYLAPKDASNWDPNPSNMGHWWSGVSAFDSMVTTGRNNEKRLKAILAHLGITDPAA